ncbi:MAG: hypothetical protein GYB67_07645 [Chloroflexi bacterium]|nr:hypothetical protein [Chloroflexota bacterium]
MTHTAAPPPDLRIVPVDHVHPHEEPDSQRLRPLVENLRQAEFIINPPVVAPVTADQYVVLDGANRIHACTALAFPHIIVQVVSYESGFVELGTWRHVVSDWTKGDFIEQLRALPEIHMINSMDARAVAHILCPDGSITAVRAAVETTHERNVVLRDLVAVYQQHATLHRTDLTEPDDVWQLFPDATALVIFPTYQPADIIAAALHHSLLPPGISRHIVHGRALRVNYPLAQLRDGQTSLAAKNDALARWVQEKFAHRGARYYAEATYQFDE